MAAPDRLVDRSGRLVAVRRSLRRAGSGLADLFGPVGAAGVVALAGMTAVIGLLWPIGVLLARQESSIDRPIYDWMRDHQAHGSMWRSLNVQVSAMAENDRTKVIVVLASVVLAVVWRRRAWWIPPLAICATYLGERFTQQLLKEAVHRGHPPTTLGTYPSGGCGRLISVWGIALLLVTMQFPRLSRRWRAMAWTVLALCAAFEGYSRTYLLKHWFTDVIGGWLFGLALLTVFAAATIVLVEGQDRRSSRRAELS